MNKINFLKKQLKTGECFLVSSPENRLYLTSFNSSDGFLFITKDDVTLFADSRYIEKAQKEAQGCDSILLLDNQSEQLPQFVSENNIETVFTEEEKLSVASFKFLTQRLQCDVKAERLDKNLSKERRSKSREEKNYIIKAQHIAEEAFGHILTFIKPGVTEKEIALELDYFMIKNGADCPAFETIALSGPNTSMPHGVPGSRRVKEGDFVTMDFGARVRGYNSDMTRTVAVGKVSDEMERVYSVVLKAQLAALSAYKAGKTCKEADGAARDIIKNEGFGEYFGHGTGHGVGIDIHENPTVSSRSRFTLEEGDIVTVEPGIYIPGKFGVRIEDMVYITKDGNENLTNAGKEIDLYNRVHKSN